MQTHALVFLPFIALISAACAAEPPEGAAEPLFSFSVQTDRAEDGKALNMTIRETVRAPEFSLVEVGPVSGDSKTSLLYLVRGLCGLMQARGQKLAVNEQISEYPIQYRLSFPKTATVEDAKGLPRMVLSESECGRLRQ